MADNYYEFPFANAVVVPSRIQQLGYNRIDVLESLDGDGSIDDTALMTMRNGDLGSDYKVKTGKTSYVMISFVATASAGARRVKVYTGPTADSLSGAVEIFDTNDLEYSAAWNASNEQITTFLMKFTVTDDFIIIENATGSSSNLITVTDAIAIEVTN